MPIQRRQGRFGRVAENLQGILDTMIKAKVQEESQARQANFVMQRQQELAQLQSRLRMEADRQQEAAKLSTNRETAFADLSKQVGGAKTLRDLPSESSIIQQAGLAGKKDPFLSGGAPIILGRETTALPDVEQPSQIHQLIQAKRAQQNTIERQLGIEQGEKPRIGPGNVEGFLDRSGQFLPTERTGSQAGQHSLDEFMAGPEFDPLARATKADQASAEAGARETGTIRARHENLDQLREIAEAGRPGGGQGPDAADAYLQERVTRTVQSVDELLPRVTDWTVGPRALVLFKLPGTEAPDFAAELETLKSSIAFGELTEMRAASKTGGALGQVSDREGILLSNSLGALDQFQSPENFKRQLEKIKAQLARWEQIKRDFGAGQATQPRSLSSDEFLQQFGGQ